MKNKPSLKEMEKAIQSVGRDEQKRLLANLPRLLNISKSDIDLLKISEKSFDFWNNADDKVYDKL